MANNNIEKAYTEFVKTLTDEQRVRLETALEKYKAGQNKPKPTKNTGYERVEIGELYYTIHNIDGFEMIDADKEVGVETDDDRYDFANYYSDITIAENNARADRLMRQLRRFAVEHIRGGVNWKNTSTNSKKAYIYCDYKINEIGVAVLFSCRDFGQIYFDSEETAELAIKTFKDELTWYFTEYKDSL